MIERPSGEMPDADDLMPLRSDRIAAINELDRTREGKYMAGEPPFGYDMIKANENPIVLSKEELELLTRDDPDTQNVKNLMIFKEIPTETIVPIIVDGETLKINTRRHDFGTIVEEPAFDAFTDEPTTLKRPK